MTTPPTSQTDAVDTTPFRSRPVPPCAPSSPPRKTWLQTRRRLRLALEDLRRTVVGHCEHHPDRPRLTVALDDAITDLEALIDSFDSPLIELLERLEQLDAAEAASDPCVGDDVRRRVGAHVADGRRRFASDELVEMMDTNGFVDLGLRSELDAALAAIVRHVHDRPPADPDEGRIP